MVGLGVTVLGLIDAPFTGGAGVVAASWIVVAAVGGVVAATGKVMQFLPESNHSNKLERIGNEFLDIVQPLNEEAKKIRAMARRLHVERVTEVEDALQQVNNASVTIEGVEFIKGMVQLILRLLQHISTEEEQQELTERLIQSGEQCWKIIKHFGDFKASTTT